MILWALYTCESKKSSIPVIIKIIIWHVNCIITILPKIKEGSVNHWFQSNFL